jgi:hypothetical protein
MTGRGGRTGWLRMSRRCAWSVRLSVRLCPALRRGAAAVRVREYPVVGVRGAALQERWPAARFRGRDHHPL